jgi:Spy/CpxP family protein refolding chaperone
MTKMKKTYLTALFTVITAMVVLSPGGGSFAAQETVAGDGSHDKRGSSMHGPGYEFGGPAAIDRMTRHLDLDEGQQEAVKSILEVARPDFESLRQQSEANREALRSLDPNDADYAVRLQSLATESGELAAGTALLHGKVRAELHAVLTPEQQLRMAEGAERMRERRGERSRREAK